MPSQRFSWLIPIVWAVVLFGGFNFGHSFQGSDQPGACIHWPKLFWQAHCAPDWLNGQRCTNAVGVPCRASPGWVKREWRSTHVEAADASQFLLCGSQGLLPVEVRSNFGTGRGAKEHSSPPSPLALPCPTASCLPPFHPHPAVHDLTQLHSFAAVSLVAPSFQHHNNSFLTTRRSFHSRSLQ